MNIKSINSKVQMSKRERVKATINFQETDRVCLFDLLHNPGVIEFFSQEKLKSAEKKAENLRIVGKAINNSLDLVRHFLIPDTPQPADSCIENQA